MLNVFDWFRARSEDGRRATELYGSIVTQARQPVFYTEFDVPDVAEKRYEMIVLHMALVLERLRAFGDDAIATRQALIEAFVRDLDGSIREMAVSDTKVPAKVKKAAGGLWDRDQLYRQAFEQDDLAGPPGPGSKAAEARVADVPVADGGASSGNAAGLEAMTTGALISEL
ncbi:MAG: hypothetical protein KKB37_14790, partial [Alphaproteobacteria bacterium]|nr:hypothetical protein [Alphaproteobacteria bacterium]